MDNKACSINCVGLSAVQKNIDEESYILTNRHVIVISKSVWNALKSKMNDITEEDEEREERIHKINEIKKKSKAVTKNWNNKLKNIHEEKIMECEQKEAFESQRRKYYTKKIMEEHKEHQRGCIERSKKELFYSKEHTKELHSALKLSEILRERSAQKEFAKEISKEKMKKKMDFATKQRQAYFQNMKDHKEEKKKSWQKKLKHGKALSEQLEQIKYYNNYIMERDRLEDIKDIERNSKEIKEDKESDRKLKYELRKQAKWYAEEGLRIKREYYENKFKQDEEEEKIFSVQAAVIQQLAALCKSRELELRRNKILAAQKLSEKVAVKDKSRESEGNAIILRYIAEKEAREKEIIQKEKAHKQMLVEELQQYYKEEKILADKRKLKEKEKTKLQDVEQIKYDEDYATELKERMEKHKQVMSGVRKGYDLQVEEKRQEEMDKINAEYSQASAVAAAWEEEDGEYLKYAEDLLVESTAKGRPLLPLTRIIKELLLFSAVIYCLWFGCEETLQHW